ncbi:uncharacterized protein si:dkey-63d15.12 [Colossoma macropomum]|uniref:uncharacterized protein si:dkey-63d15.12 n=1 Tax=Colossoma macropomum TaxID=42526 RepID=UPI0018653592|nr:uncharacterized protein si:dkey-63d15.12 [Colossoma macropomum]
MTHIRSLYTSLLSLFITGCLCGSDLTVWQTPKIINATEGQHVNISCHFTIKSIKSTWVQLSIAWWRNNETKEVQQELYNNSALNSDSVNHSSVLQIPSVRLNHSGIYYCTVLKELPMLGVKIYGPGTELRVDVVPSQGSTTNHSAVTVIAASALISVLITVLITSVIFIIYRAHHKRPKQQSEGEI